MRRPIFSIVNATTCAVLLAACGGGGSNLRVGDEPAPAADAGDGRVGPPLDSSVGDPGRPDGSLSVPLSVAIERAEGIAIELIVVECDGACAEVRAVASGGWAPYTYRWSDGETHAAREVCTEDVGNLSVEATDSGLNAGEFTEASKTSSASLKVERMPCGEEPPDAGAPPTSQPQQPLQPGECLDILAAPMRQCGDLADSVAIDVSGYLAPNTTYELWQDNQTFGVGDMNLYEAEVGEGPRPSCTIGRQLGLRGFRSPLPGTRGGGGGCVTTGDTAPSFFVETVVLQPGSTLIRESYTLCAGCSR